MQPPHHYIEDRFEDRLPDWYWEAMIRFRSWRERRFPWYYKRQQARLHTKNMMEKFGFVPGVGDWVEDCRGIEARIASVDEQDPDTVTFGDGFSCSLWHCCGPAHGIMALTRSVSGPPS